MNYIYITSKWSKMLLCRKTFQTTENYKSDQIGRQNEQNVELRRKPFKTAKLQKWSKYNDLHRFDVKTIKATQNSKRDQITMNLHRFDVQTIKNVELRRKPFKTGKLQKRSKYNDLHRFVVKNFKTTQNCKSNQITMNYIYITSKWSKMLLRRKTFQTTENYKSDQIIMNCIDLTSKRSKMLSYVAKHSKQR